jgi:patatin-like phospholipase/acyl hydrolase
MNSNSANPYYILSLDGGGPWALIEVMALQKLFGENAKGHQVLQKFQLAAANSGGSIALGAMAANYSLADILGMLWNADDRSQVFQGLGLQSDLAKLVGFGPQYSTAGKLIGLQTLLPETNEVYSKVWAATGNEPNPPDILIPAFDYDRCRATFFRSNLNSAAANYPRSLPVTLLNSIHASTTAPVNFFDQPASIGEDRYWDGAVGGYNNPVLAAVVEAIANNTPRQQIRALSIGTGNVFLPVQNDQGTIPEQLAHDRYEASFALTQELHDLKQIAGSIIDDPPDAASFEAHVALDQRLPKNAQDVVDDGNIVRMNPMIQPIYNDKTGQWQCPSDFTLDDFQTLANIPMDAVKQDDVNMIVNFCEAWIGGAFVNQPIRMNWDNFAVEIGQRFFSDAMAAWRKLQP